MKLLGILLSFALAGHVLGTELDKYIEEVILTNEEIKKAKDFMPKIIKHIVESPDVYWMEAMAFMLSRPELIDIKLGGADYDTDSDENIVSTLEEPGHSQNQIPDLNIDPSTVPEEGPSQNEIPDLNLDPSTVSEEDIKNPNFVGKTIIQLKEKLEYQKMMQLAILAVTDRAKYENIMQSAISATTDTIPIQSLDLNYPPDHNEKRRIEAPTIKLENLASVLEERRHHPRAVSKNRIIRAFGLTSLGEARRKMTLEAITSLIRQNDPVFRNLYKMCRLAGLFRTIKYPRSYYIASTDLDEECCILNDVFYEEGFVYKFDNDEFWEVDPYRHHVLIKPFLSELE